MSLDEADSPLVTLGVLGWDVTASKKVFSCVFILCELPMKRINMAEEQTLNATNKLFVIT